MDESQSQNKQKYFVIFTKISVVPKCASCEVFAAAVVHHDEPQHPQHQRYWKHHGREHEHLHVVGGHYQTLHQSQK